MRRPSERNALHCTWRQRVTFACARHVRFRARAIRTDARTSPHATRRSWAHHVCHGPITQRVREAQD